MYPHYKVDQGFQIMKSINHTSEKNKNKKKELKYIKQYKKNNKALPPFSSQCH